MEDIKNSLTNDNVQHFMQNELYIPTRTLWIGPMDEDNPETNSMMAERAIKNLHILDSQSDEPIEILMLNYGGEVIAGMAIYDAIMICSSFITIKVFGCASSMGSIILQAADKRLLAPNSEVMIHMGEAAYASNHPENIDRQHKRAIEYDKWMIDMYWEKIKESKSRYKRKDVENLCQFDSIFTPEKAVKFGLADGVIEIFKGHKIGKE